METSLPKLLLKTFFLTFAFLLFFLLITAVGLGLFAKQKLDVFAGAAGVSVGQLIDLAQAGLNTSPQQANNHVNFLILGTDDLSNRGSNTQLTDTMILASLNLQTAQVSLYSLPRDLWSDEYDTKINALFQYGKDRYPSDPQRFPREVISQLTGVSIQHVVIINLDTLANLIDVMGGIDINVKTSFVDNEFPRSDVDVTKVHDPKLLYETVSFAQGVEHMSGARVLEYVRSRHSTDETQGNDVARGQRQQEVILAVIETLKNPRFYLDVTKAGRLYKFYNDHFASALPLTEVIGIGKQIYPMRNQFKFESAAPSIFPDDPNGVITHPAISAKYQKQWVYVVRDAAALQKEVQAKLKL
jgi:LCP family protein required for cell wall assembly